MYIGRYSQKSFRHRHLLKPKNRTLYNHLSKKMGKAKILVVEDEHRSDDELMRDLNHQGYTVVSDADFNDAGNEKKYRQVFENSLTTYFEVSTDGRLLDISPSIQRYTKYQQSDLVGSSIFDLHADPQAMKNIINKALKSGELDDEEIPLKDKDGTTRVARLRARFVSEEQKIIGSIRDISEFKKAEEKLKSSETSFQNFVDSSPMGLHMYRLVSDDRLIFTGANPAANRILGVDNSQFFGKTIEEAFPKLSKTEVPQRYKIAATDGIPWRTEHIDYQDNEIKGAFEVHVFQMTPGNVAVLFFDITERKQTEQALRESEERSSLVLDVSNLGFFDRNIGKNTVIRNYRAAEIFGYSLEEMENNRDWWESRIHPDDRKRVLKKQEAYLSGEQANYETEYRLLHKSGEWRTIRSTGKVVRRDEAGNPQRFIGTLEDLTQRIKTQELMVQTEKIMSVGGLAAGMAHEINNPLGAILQGTQNLMRRLDADFDKNHDTADRHNLNLKNLEMYLRDRGIHDIISGMRDSAKKAADIVSNMLQYSRRSESHMAPNHMIHIIQQAVELARNDYDLKKKYDFRNVEIIEDFDRSVEIVICTETEIEQVILNLLRNAAHALTVCNPPPEMPQIVLRTKKEGDMIRIDIKDNGPGMDMETRKRLFEPFFTTKPVGEGTGLGLSVSYMIITKNHRGTMEVESEIGKGTNFIIKIPLERRKASTSNNLN